MHVGINQPRCDGETRQVTCLGTLAQRRRVTQRGDTTFFDIRGVSSLFMSGLPPDVELRLLLYGSTENQTVTYRDPVTGLIVFPDLSPTFGDEEFINP